MRDCRQRSKDEFAFGEPGMRDREAPRAELPAAPGDKIEVQPAFAPSSARPPAELPLEGLELRQHRPGFQAAFEQHHGIGEVAAGAADGLVEDDRRGVEQVELGIQPSDGRLDLAVAADLRLTAVKLAREARVASVRTGRQVLSLASEVFGGQVATPRRGEETRELLAIRESELGPRRRCSLLALLELLAGLAVALLVEQVVPFLEALFGGRV